LIDVAIRERAVGWIEPFPDAAKQLADGRLKPRCGVAERSQHGIDTCQSEPRDQDVGRSIVAGDDHLGDEVAVGRPQTRRKGVQHPRSAPEIIGTNLVALIEIKRARFGSAIGTHHNGELDDTECVEGIIAADGDRFGSGKMLGKERGLGA
jgi:hypothetical protein